jgi:hypothetical protein
MQPETAIVPDPRIRDYIDGGGVRIEVHILLAGRQVDDLRLRHRFAGNLLADTPERLARSGRIGVEGGQSIVHRDHIDDVPHPHAGNRHARLDQRLSKDVAVHFALGDLAEIRPETFLVVRIVSFRFAPVRHVS